MEQTKLPQALLEHLPWGPDADPIWPATTFHLRRNLTHHLFPSKLKKPLAAQLLPQLKEALITHSKVVDPAFFAASDLPALDKEYLFEHFLCREGFQHSLEGQGFLLDNSAKFLALFNIQDHLQLQLTECKNELESAWEHLSKIDTALCNALDFAFSPKFGFLTSDPALSGTGLKITAFLHLPALIHNNGLHDALAKQNEQEIEATNMQGSENDYLGDLLILTNRYTLGTSEDKIFYSIHSSAMELIILEKTLRDHLREERNPEMKNQVSRAFGLLKHSYQLQTKETLNALSLMKLGLDLGWIKGVEDMTINEVFFLCRRAHLAYLFREDDQSTLPRKRAELIHERLAAMELVEE